MLQPSLLELSRVGVNPCNLLNSRVIIATYNNHLRLLSPGPWLVCTPKAYSGVVADIVMESIWRVAVEKLFRAEIAKIELRQDVL